MKAQTEAFLLGAAFNRAFAGEYEYDCRRRLLGFVRDEADIPPSSGCDNSDCRCPAAIYGSVIYIYIYKYI